MFALLSRDELYLRVDQATRDRFRQAGCPPFGYDRAGRNVVIDSYYALPDSLYDQPEELVNWAGEAVAAARRSQRPRKRNKRPIR